MPQLDIDTSVDLVDARVVVSFNRLSEVLRMVIDQVNQHDGVLSGLVERTEDLEVKQKAFQLELDILKPDGDRQKALEADFTGLKNNLAALREETERRHDLTSKHHKARLEALEVHTKTLDESTTRDTAQLFQGVTVATAASKEANARLDALVIPDIQPLQRDVKDLYNFRASQEQKMIPISDFINLWGADPVETRKLSALRSDGSQLFAQEARTSYAKTLPPMTLLDSSLREELDKNKDYVDFKVSEVTERLNDKVSKKEIAEIANDVKQQHVHVQEAIGFVDRRLKDTEEFTTRCIALESTVKKLDTTKADKADLEHLATSETANILRKDNVDMHEEINDIVDKMSHFENQIGALGKSNFQLLSSSAPSVRRQSVLSAAMSPGKAPVSPTPQQNSLRRSSSMFSEEKNRKISELEESVAQLKAGKADRSELNRIYDYLETLETHTNSSIEGVKKDIVGVEMAMRSGGANIAATKQTSRIEPHGRIGSASMVRQPSRPMTSNANAGRSLVVQPLKSESTPPDHLAVDVAGPARVVAAAENEESSRQGESSTSSGRRDVSPARSAIQHKSRSVTTVHDSSGAAITASVITGSWTPQYKYDEDNME